MSALAQDPSTSATRGGTDVEEAFGRRVALLIGAPRSGTTWLGKILDSHPDTLYLHEPDTVIRSTLPVVCASAEVDRLVPAARSYLESLLAVRSLKTSAILPLFAKRYRGPFAEAGFRAAVLSLHCAEAAIGRAAWLRGIPLPDFGALSDPAVRVVVKSVSARGRARLFARALPGCRTIVLLRHPCGQVASMLRGYRLGKFEGDAHLDEVLSTETAGRLGLDRAAFERLSEVERFAWHWAAMNQKAVDDLGGDAAVIRYEDVCANPIEGAHALLDAVGVDWRPEVEAFVRRSTSSGTDNRYYGLFKDPTAAAWKWRRELDEDDQRKILAIARRVEVGRAY